MRRLRALFVVVAAILAILGILAVIAAVIYLVDPASSIPSVLPGRVAGLSGHRTHRAIALFILTAILWVLSGVSSYLARPRRRRGSV
ncbi:MAG: hypothetical protein ACRDY2_01820 [Acidimicrobiales bacterium]